MSQFLMVPISGQGTITDANIKTALPGAMVPPFAYSDLFLYSHGWWTTAEGAMIDYNRYLLGLTRIMLLAGGVPGPTDALGIGIHWPSVLTEDENSPLRIFQPLTYFNRASMANTVGEHGGYSIVRLVLEARKNAGLAPPRIHLIGHSFGCKVLCAALEALVTSSTRPLLDHLIVNVVLIQAAFDWDAFEPGQEYGDLLTGVPKLRMLVTKSSLDEAVGLQYDLVQKAVRLFSAPVPGLGAKGPSPSTLQAAGAVNLSIGPGFTPPGGPDSPLCKSFVVADLEPLHQAHPEENVPLAGHHTDIFHDEIYRMIAGFLFASRA